MTTSTGAARRRGLLALAGVNLLSTLAATIFVILRVRGTLQTESGAFDTVTGLIAGVLALVSAIGFVRRSHTLGYVVGNVFGVYLLAYSVAFLAARGSVNPMEYFAWLSYPIVLLTALNTVFRREFEHPAA